MDAAERSAKFLADLEDVENMSREELLAELNKLAAEGGVAGLAASAALELNKGRGRTK